MRMQAIGAAGSSAAGWNVAPAAPSGVPLTGAVAPAMSLTGVAATTPSSFTQAPASLDLEALALDAAETAELFDLRGGGASGIRVTARSQPTPREVLATIHEPDPPSVVGELEARRADVRDKLITALRTGAGNGGILMKQLDELDALVRIMRRSEERKRLMKELMRKLLMGVLTPTLIRQAKAMGLTSFLKDAIRSMLQAGNISPQQAKAMSTLLAAAGIRMPELDEFLLRHEQAQAGLVDAARAARGLTPTTAGSSGIGGLASGTGTSTAGAAQGAAALA